MPTSIWKGSISFGLLNIPVTLEKAEEGHELSFSMLDEKDMAPIKYKKVSGKSGKEVPWSRVVKGYEYQKGKYVVLSKEELRSANPKASQTIDIEDFVEASEIDLMFLEKPYYLVPQKTGVKGYFLLSEALKKTKKVAIAKIVIRTKMHLAMIMAKDNYLVLELLRFGHEVLDADEVDYLLEVKKPHFSPKEIKMAQELIMGMTSKWNPNQYKDTYNDDVLKLVKTKVKTGKVEEIEWEEPEKEVATGKVLDLLPLLRKSLEEKKKIKKKSVVRKKAG